MCSDNLQWTCILAHDILFHKWIFLWIFSILWTSYGLYIYSRMLDMDIYECIKVYEAMMMNLIRNNFLACTAHIYSIYSYVQFMLIVNEHMFSILCALYKEWEETTQINWIQENLMEIISYILAFTFLSRIYDIDLF